jgi:uncharacterized protein (UPF0333 family)
MILNKKGQAAMEFLMTYGWALLVVLIAIAALAFFGLLNPSRFLPERCEIAPGLTCMDFNAQHKGDNNATITILLNNGIGQTMRNVTINITECGVGSQMYNPNGLEIIIVEGQTERIEYNCSGTVISNTRFRSGINIEYNTTVATETLRHSKAGYLVVQVD